MQLSLFSVQSLFPFSEGTQIMNVLIRLYSSFNFILRDFYFFKSTEKEGLNSNVLTYQNENIFKSIQSKMLNSLKTARVRGGSSVLTVDIYLYYFHVIFYIRKY